MGTAKSIRMQKQGASDKTAVPSPDAHVASWTGRSFAGATLSMTTQLWRGTAVVQPPRSDPVPTYSLPCQDKGTATAWGASLCNKYLQRVLRTSSAEVSEDLLNRRFRGWRWLWEHPNQTVPSLFTGALSGRLFTGAFSVGTEIIKS